MSISNSPSFNGQKTLHFEQNMMFIKKDVLLYLISQTIIHDLALSEDDIASPQKECYSKNRMMKGMMDE